MKLSNFLVVIFLLGIYATPAYAQAPLTVPLEYIKIENNYSCVGYVRSKIPSFPFGDADTQIPNSTPQIGGVVIFQYKTLGHVAIITKLETDGFWVDEFNYEPGRQTSRFVSWNDGRIRGFWSAKKQ